MQANKVFLTIVILILACILLFVVTIPQYQKLNEVQESLVKKQAEYEGKFIYYSKIASIIKEIEENPATLEKVSDALPKDFSYASVVNFLQNKGIETGLLVKSISFSPTALPLENQQVASVDFTIDLEGNYMGLKNFIYSLENSARLFQIDSITFDADRSVLGSIDSPDVTGIQAQESIYDFELGVKVHTY